MEPINRGAVGALNYNLPIIPAVQSKAQTPYDDGLEALQGLQDANGEANAYYKKVAALKAFMHDVNTNYGIDVRVPDLSRPESIKLNEIYRNALADVMAQGNLLKTSFQIGQTNQQMGNIYAPGIDAAKTPIASMTPGQDYYARQFEPTVTEINNKLQMPSQTEEEHQQKLALYNQSLKHYDELIAQHPERAEYYKYQKGGITAPTKGDWRPYQDRLPWQMYSGYQKQQAAGNFVKDITNIQHGTSGSYKLDTKVLNPQTGDPLHISTSYQGTEYGTGPDGKPLVIEKWGYDPKTSQSFVFFKNGTSAEITKDNALAITRGILGSNTKQYGLDAEYVDEWAQRNKLLDEYGQFAYGTQLPDSTMQIHNRMLGEQGKTTTQAQQKTLQADLEDFNKNSTTYWLAPDPSKEYKARNNQTVVVKRDGPDKLYIANFKDLIPPPAEKAKQPAWQRNYKEYGKDGTTPARLKALLIKLGVHESMNLGKSGTTSAGSTPDNDPLGIRK